MVPGAHGDTALVQQLRDIAILPEIIGLRVMPDVHYGKGATVGSVIAMRNALAPAAVEELVDAVWLPALGWRADLPG